MMGFQASAAMRTRSALFWDFTQCRTVAPGRPSRHPIGPNLKDQAVQEESVLMRPRYSPSTAGPLKVGLLLCPETSARNYHSTLRNIPEEDKPHGLAQFTFTALLCDMHKAHSSL